MIRMVELPETHVLVQQINQTIRGKKVKNASANGSPHAFATYSGDPEHYPGMLKDLTALGAEIYGGNVKIKFEDTVLLLTTPIRFHEAGDKIPKKHQLYIEFYDSSSLTCTIQMWGGIFCFKEDDQNGIPKQHTIKETPTPLDDEFNEIYFKSLLEKEKLTSLSAKAFLATEQRIVGIGNGVLQDILWTARIHPKRKMSTLSEIELNNLFRAVKDVMANMVRDGGRDTERDLYGNYGGYKTILSKNSVNRLCHVCGTPFQKEAYLGGSIYYCKGCQKL